MFLQAYEFLLPQPQSLFRLLRLLLQSRRLVHRQIKLRNCSTLSFHTLDLLQHICGMPTHVTSHISNDFHKEYVIGAMRAGKAAISEKPVTLSSADLQDMIDVSRETGKLFTVHQNRRWDVDFLAMKQLAESDEIGEPIRIESRIHGSRGIPSDWRGIKQYGGGMLYDWGIHLIDQALMVLGWDVDTVNCRFDNITNTEVDDGFHLDLYFEDDVTARIEVGTSNFISLPRFYMRAQNGSAIITDWRVPAHVVKCKAWHESDVIPVQTAAGLTKTMAPRDEKSITEKSIPQPAADVHDFYRNVCRAIDGTEPQLVTHGELMRVMRVMEAAFESDRLGGAPVTFEDTL
mgnify:CR=1 FL=1